MPSMDESTLYLQHLYFCVALPSFENGWCAFEWIFCTSVFLCIFCICIIWSFCEGPRMDDASAEQDAVFQIFSGWHFVYFVFAGSAPLLLGCSENGWCALASLKAAINWMSPQGKRQTWRRTLYPQDKYWCSHCCQTNTHDCHWLHTFQMYLQPHWWLFLVVILISWMSPQSNVCKQQTWRRALTAGNVHLSHLYYNIHVIIT